MRHSGAMTWRRIVLVALALTGCGRVGFGELARSDAPGDDALIDARPLDGAAPLPPFGVTFTTPALQPSLNTSNREYGPTLSRDGLDVYFSGFPNATAGEAGLGGATIFEAHRASTSSPFGTRAIVTALETADHDGEPSLGSFDSRMYFMRGFDAGIVTTDRLGASWTAAEVVPELAIFGIPDVAVGDTHLVASKPGDQLWTFTRASPADPWGQAIHATELEPGAAPSLREDGLEIFFESDRDGGLLQIYRATRTSLTAPWSAPELVDLGGLAPAGDPDISADGRTLIFVASPVVEFDIYIATRDPL